jgi:hypothetical protein
MLAAFGYRSVVRYEPLRLAPPRLTFEVVSTQMAPIEVVAKDKPPNSPIPGRMEYLRITGRDPVRIASRILLAPISLAA